MSNADAVFGIVIFGLLCVVALLAWAIHREKKR